MPASPMQRKRYVLSGSLMIDGKGINARENILTSRFYLIIKTKSLRKYHNAFRVLSHTPFDQISKGFNTVAASNGYLVFLTAGRKGK
jgi:hypothetical protein